MSDSKTITSFQELKEYPVDSLFLGTDGQAYRIVSIYDIRKIAVFTKTGTARIDTVLDETGDAPFPNGFSLTLIWRP